jgi:nucleotide-binding universal stress UspA family protein
VEDLHWEVRMKLLVTMDGSSFSEAVLPAAIRVAGDSWDVVLASVVKRLDDDIEAERRMDAIELQKSRVDETGRILPMMPDPALETTTAVRDLPSVEVQNAEETREYLEDLSRRYFNSRAKAVVHVADDAVEEVRAIIAEEKPDIVAMATHGRTGVASLLTGSMAKALLESAGVPLLLVRPEGLR